MTGSLQIKSNKYYMVLNTYENGKRKTKWRGTGLPVKGNKKKAEQMLRDAIAEQEQLQGIMRSDILFGDAVRQWLKCVKPRVDEATFQGYECLANSHILPYFDAMGIKLVDVTRQVLQAYISEKAARGRLDGAGGLAPASLRLHKNILQQTLNEAIENDLIAANPCDRVALPQAQRYEGKFYTVSQLNMLFDCIKDEPLYPLVYITAFYGLRRSEVLGLQWDSLDFEAGTLTIKHTVVKVTQVIQKDKTKNTSSHRTFPLSESAKAIFLQAKQHEEENRIAFGKQYSKNNYIFKWEDGRPFSPDYVSHNFRRLLCKYGLPPIRFHELRHSCASLLIANGYSLKDVQEWLGHSDIKMTANIYSHLDVTRKIGISDDVQKLLPAASSQVLEKC